MSDEERRYLHFHVINSRCTGSKPGSNTYRVSVELTTHSTDYDLIGIVEKRISELGIKIYETDGLLNEAITTLQADLEEEKKRHLHHWEKMDAELLEANQRLSFLMAELQKKDQELTRLKKMESELTEIAGLQVPEVIS